MRGFTTADTADIAKTFNPCRLTKAGRKGKNR